MKRPVELLLQGANKPILTQICAVTLRGRTGERRNMQRTNPGVCQKLQNIPGIPGSGRKGGSGWKTTGE